MKNIKIIITFLLLSLSVKAQKVPYEKLEAFSKEISQFQLEVNGKSYNDGSNNIEISFPEENFTIAFNNQLATNVVYKKSNNKELMYLTENFSLGRVVGFTSEVMDNIVVWKVNFGKFTVTTQVFEDGKLIDTTVKNEMLLYSYINTNRKASAPTFLNSFSELCNTMKKSIGLITDKELESENKDWTDKNYTMTDFVTKHPNSVRTMQGKNIIANKEKLKLELGKKATSIIEYATEICKAYLWKPNMTEKEFKSYNPTINKESWTTYYSDRNSHYSRKLGIHLTVGGYLSEGPQSYTVNKFGEVSAFGTTIKKEKNSSKEIRKMYENTKQISKEKVGSSNFSEKKASTESFTISVPKSAEDPNSFQYYITTHIFDVDKWSIIQIYFHTTNNP